ncbi:MAG: hypothetical protein WAN14_15675 [Candidatus Acidiferrales bacterium]
MHHDASWWALVLAILALVLMLPVNLLANVITPTIANYVFTRTKKSLIKRITRLEGQLAEVEKNPAITEVENQILWGLRSIHIRIIGVESITIIVFYFGISALADIHNQAYKLFFAFVFVILILNFALQIYLRYEHDFRFNRSPDRRKALSTEIEKLKKIQANWP